MSLNGVFVLGEGRDKRIWEPDEKEEFSVKSFHSSLMRQGEVPTASPKIWRACVPPKVKILGRLAGLGRVLTVDQLGKRRMLINLPFVSENSRKCKSSLPSRVLSPGLCSTSFRW